MSDYITLLEALDWISFGDGRPTTSEAGEDEPPAGPTPMPGEWIWHGAERRLVARLQAGEIEARGHRRGSRELEPIPTEFWQPPGDPDDLLLMPLASAARYDPDDDERGVWLDIELPRDDLYRLWPACRRQALDPFRATFWNLTQVLIWGYVRRRVLVRHAVDPDCRMDILLLGPAVKFGFQSSLDDAQSELIDGLCGGQLRASGLLNGRGDRESIPEVRWLDLTFRFDEGSHDGHAGPRDPHRPDATYWTQLAFDRAEVLALWPDPLEEAHARAAPMTAFMSLHDALDWIAFRGLPAPEPPQDAREAGAEGDDSAPDRAPAGESPTASPRVLGQGQGALAPAPSPEAARDADSDAAGEDDEDWPEPRALTEAEAAWAAAWEEAEPRLVAELQRGELPAWGKKRYGQMEQIPRGFWIHAPQPGRRSGGLTLEPIRSQAFYENEPDRGEWTAIAFDRHDVLRLWPDLQAQSSRTTLSPAPRVAPKPISDRELRCWLSARIQGRAAAGLRYYTREEDEKAARAEFPGRVTRPRVRAMRKELLPDETLKGGAPRRHED